MIIQDIFDQQRSFLPGKRCSPDHIRGHFNLPILIDGLDNEEAALILSTLPRDADGIYLSPLDKGLSGSKVYVAKYHINNRKSKLFVFKIGPRLKIEKESESIGELVCPHISGVLPPVFRKGIDKALIAQEFSGLGINSKLQSLRLYITETEQGEQIVSRLFNQRLGNWYLPRDELVKIKCIFGSLFEKRLAKNPGPFLYPEKWQDLQNWVYDETGLAYTDIQKVVESVQKQTIYAIKTTVHGDLHAQNILIDEKEESWIIDYAWCRENASPLVDFTMLECSLKFFAIPFASNLKTLLKVENSLCREQWPSIKIENEPYNDEIKNILRAIKAIRSFAMDTMQTNFGDYRKSLFLMTYSLVTYPGLNKPYILSSLQILSNIIKREG